MLIDFFLHLKACKLPVSTREFLTVLEGLRDHVCGPSIDEFYFFARTCLVKDESFYDRFDQAFGEYFKGVTTLPGLEVELPEDWLAHGNPWEFERTESSYEIGFGGHVVPVPEPDLLDSPAVIDAGDREVRVHRLRARAEAWNAAEQRPGLDILPHAQPRKGPNDLKRARDPRPADVIR